MATYYVKNGGNDNASGLSDALAWGTLARAQNHNIAPGDVILFARGSKWREQLFLYQKSGTAQAPYRLGAYGTGDLPEFIGSNVITGWATEAAGGTTGEVFTDGTGSVPVAYWMLTETSGGRVAGGGGNILSPSPNAPTKGTGPAGLSSVEFAKANSQELRLTQSGMSTGFPGTQSGGNQSVTFGGRIRIDAETGADAGIMGIDTAFQLIVEGYTVQVRVFESGNQSARSSAANAQYPSGSWVHYAGRYNATTGEVVLFVNGIKMTPSGTPAASQNLWTGDFVIGQTLFKGFFDGAIAEPFVFNTVLTDSQILSIAEKGLSGSLVLGAVTNYYYRSMSPAPGFVYVNDALMAVSSTKVGMTPGSVWYDTANSRLYVRTAASDNPSSYVVEACVRDFSFRPQLCDNWICEDIHFSDSLVSGVFPDNVNNAEFLRCEFSRNTHNGAHHHTFTNLSTSGMKFTDCYAHHNGGTGITISGNYATSMDNVTIKGCHTHNNCLNMNLSWSGGIRPIGVEVTNCIVEDCHVHDEGFNDDFSRGCGIWFDTVGAGCIARRNLVERTSSWGIQVESCSGMVVESNIIVGTIYYPGIAVIRDCDNNHIRNNTIVNCITGIDLSNWDGSHFNGNQFYNNIVLGETNYVIQCLNGVSTATQASFNRNALGPQRTNFINWNGGISTYAAWETAMGATSNSFQADVTFVNSAAGNYRLTDTSVGKSAGAPVPSGTLDFSQVAFNATTPSIGAYENVVVVETPKPTKAEYKTALTNVRASFAGAGSIGLFSIFPLMHRTEGTSTDANVQKIRQAHYEYITENPSTVNLGWTPDVPLSDGINQTAAGSEIIAYSYAHALLYSMGAVTQQSIGPRITAATRNGAVVSLAVVHNGGTSLKTQTGATPTGFQVFPMGSVHTDGAALAISSVALAASTITITLAADPGVSVDVYYQYGKFDNTAPVFDNSTALGRAVGNPLQPLMVPVQSSAEASPLANPAIKLNGTDAWIRWSDSVRWDTPDADWTMGVFAKISSREPINTATTAYLLSGGTYAGVNSFNLLLHRSNAAAGNIDKVEFTIRGAGATSFTAKPATVDLNAVNTNWRWWIMDFVKSTETINLYYCNINGARTLYATVAAPALGIVGPTTGPAAGTRAPPAVGSGLYLNGGVYEFFKINGLLTAGEVAQLATGVDIRTGLGKTTQIHHYFRSLSTPIGDAAGTGLAAALNGPVELFEGPIYT